MNFCLKKQRSLKFYFLLNTVWNDEEHIHIQLKCLALSVEGIYVHTQCNKTNKNIPL